MSKLSLGLMVLASLGIGAFGAGLVKERVKYEAQVRACLGGRSPDVCTSLGRRAYGIRELDRARAFLGAACGANQVEACTDLSAIYFITKDYDSALKYAKLGCEQEDPAGCYNVACAYCRKEQPAEAARVLKILASRGYFWTAENKEHSLQDPDLACLRADGTLEKIVSQ